MIKFAVKSEDLDIRTTILSALFLLSSIGAGAQIADKSYADKVAERLDSLLEAPLFQTTQVGLMVYDLTADSALYRRGERQRMRPASTMKVLTAVCALDILGGSYLFKTSLNYRGQLLADVFQGDLYLVGGFDPRFNADDMQAFVESVRRLGVDTIRGRIVADKSFKGLDKWGEGWCWDDDNPLLCPLLLSGEDNMAERFVVGLRRAGLVVQATIAEGYAPADSYNLCTRTHTIDQVLMRMMKHSDNLYAEALFYQIAALSGPYAEDTHARARINGVIEKLGFNPDDYYVADGSGLSLYNYLSAELEVALLRHAHSNPEIFNHLYPSLPVAGRDGTLKKRLTGKNTLGNVHAKTGTLTAITSLAGYLTAPNGHLLCFCIINQGVVKTTRPGRQFQDEVCRALTAP